METKYLRLDLEAIRRDFPEVWANYEKEFVITPRIGHTTEYPAPPEKDGVIAGNNEFHFLLTKR